MSSRAGIRLDYVVKVLERERAIREQRTAEFYDKLEEMRQRGDKLLENKTKRLKLEGIDVDIERIRKESKVTYMASRQSSSSEDYTSETDEDSEERDEDYSDCDSYQSNTDFHSYRNPDYELYRGTGIDYGAKEKITALASIQENNVVERLKTITVTPGSAKGPKDVNSNAQLIRRESLKSLRSSSKSKLEVPILPPMSNSRRRLRRVETKLQSVSAFNKIRHKRKKSNKLMCSSPGQFEFESSPEGSPKREQVTVNGVRNVARAVKAMDSFKDNHRRKSRKPVQKRSSSKSLFSLD